MKKSIFYTVLLLSFCFSSCTQNNKNNSSAGSNSVSTNTNNSQNTESTSNSCACSTSDANRLAYQIVDNFTKVQNELPSDVARVISVESIEARDNCTWVATFKISWPFGNTDGAHPDEYLKKRFACDGKEIYEQ